MSIPARARKRRPRDTNALAFQQGLDYLAGWVEDLREGLRSQGLPNLGLAQETAIQCA